ncbi:MAG: 2-amino-4-hydroxy-6-hydroxymethyldihydropteridine diphosphokinase [Paludibacteraceae bacterium]|nr:2-amino-4-hydroxy-6-hydroxymethyldihydropteridine diphosphokinase [Paludibacteraceae bacterium]
MIAYLGIGSNLGNTTENLQQAVLLLRRYAGEVLSVSDIYHSMPQGFESENEFANIVVRINTQLSPKALLHITQGIEKQMGRTEKTQLDNNGKPLYHDRIVDIDILEYENVEIKSKELVLPHPRIAERDFVRIPLNQVKNSTNV